MPGLKAKTIKGVIRKKLNAFFQSIEDPTLRERVEKNTIVTGGCIASMLLGEPVNDYDIYFRDRETAIQVARYFVEKFKVKVPVVAIGVSPVKLYVDESQSDRVAIVAKSVGVVSEASDKSEYDYFEGRSDDASGEYVAAVLGDPGTIEDTHEEVTEAALQGDAKEPDYRPIFLSTNAITLSGKIQIVTRFYGDASTIHGNFDFAHCMNYWCSWNDELTLRQAALEALLSRELRYVGSRYPICSVIRLRKFLQRGWRINAGQILKMVMQISELNLKDVAVLRDQLTGVDAAYFIQLIHKLKEKDPDKVNAAYLVEIIDRMF